MEIKILGFVDISLTEKTVAFATVFLSSAVAVGFLAVEGGVVEIEIAFIVCFVLRDP